MNLNKIIELYSNTSKHSNYQILHHTLDGIINQNQLNINSRYESERATFIKNKISFKNLTVADIGGNTGYFAFDSLHENAKSVDFYEGNKDHSLFVNEISNYLDLNINVYDKYINFSKLNFERKYDLIFNLNVMHHLGDDFGDKSISKESALAAISLGLKELSYYSKWMIFQIGFCWKGDINQGFFRNGTKDEMISFIENSIDGYWEVDSIGIAEMYKKEITFNKRNSNNSLRFDELGEFLNRPLFILKSLSYD